LAFFQGNQSALACGSGRQHRIPTGLEERGVYSLLASGSFGKMHISNPYVYFDARKEAAFQVYNKGRILPTADRDFMLSFGFMIGIQIIQHMIECKPKGTVEP